MDPNTFPTKGNLILAKNSLSLSKQGFDFIAASFVRTADCIREIKEMLDRYDTLAKERGQA